MEVKHTPLPWSVCDNYDVKSEKTHADVMLSPFAMLDEEAMSNAEFIARACNSHYELLEALRELYVDLVANDQDGLIEHVEPMRKARAAIAKAEGRS